MNLVGHVVAVSWLLLVSRFKESKECKNVAVNIWIWMQVDRIHISVGVGKELHGLIVSLLDGLKDAQTDWVPNGKITITKHQYHRRLNYYPVKGRKIADMEIGATKSKQGYFRLGLYPSKFGPGEFQHFKEMLELLMPFSYEKLFETGRVSYIELAQDSLTHVAHTYIPFRARCNCSSIYADESGKGSTYLGSKASSLRFCVYDKHKQQVEKKLPAAYETRTRFESRSRHIGLSPFELTEKMVNPFKWLEIADLQAAREASKEKAWQQFLDLCVEIGSASALAQQVKQQRKQFMKMLRAVAVPWWNPQDVWQGFPRALKTIAP